MFGDYKEEEWILENKSVFGSSYQGYFVPIIEVHIVYGDCDSPK